MVPRKQFKVGTYNQISNGDPTAFTLEDIVFKDAGHNTIFHSNVINCSAIKRVTLRWQWQKNGTRLETKSYSRNIHGIKLDAVKA